MLCGKLLYDETFATLTVYGKKFILLLHNKFQLP